MSIPGAYIQECTAYSERHARLLRAIERCTPVAQRLGLTFELTADEPQHAWDGSGVIRIPADASHDIPSHELGHYIVATKEERRMPEYGMGKAPYGRDTNDLGTEFKNHLNVSKESMASVVGIVMQLRWEDHASAMFSYHRHVWDFCMFRYFLNFCIVEGYLTVIGGKPWPVLHPSSST